MTKATFRNRSEAEAVMAEAHAAGRIAGWNDRQVFGKVYVRFQRDGRWFDLLASDIARLVKAEA